MDLNNIVNQYYFQLGKKGHENHEGIVRAVFEALMPMFDLPATPENMLIAQRAANHAIQSTEEPVIAALHEAFDEIINALVVNHEKDLLQQEKNPILFERLNDVTNHEARDAVFSGHATIGQLFELQPSIFC